MRTKKAILIFLVAFLALIVRSIANFIVIRLFIKTFGNEMNGLVATAGQMLEYLNILDGGLSVAIVTMLFSPLAQKDYDKANRIIAAANKYYRKIGLIFYTCLFILAYVYAFWIQRNIDPKVVFWIIILAGAVNFPNFFIVPGYNFLLIADQREYIVSFFNIIAYILGPAMMIVLMDLEYNVYVVRCIPVVMNIFVAICLKYYVSVKYKWVNIKSKSDIVLKNQVKDTILHKISGLIVFNTDMIVLSIATSFSEVSIYSVYLSIYYIAKNILAPIIASGRVGLGQILAEGDLPKAQKVFSTYEYISFLIAFILLTTLSIVAVPFIKIYADGLNGLQYSDTKLNILFSIMFLMDLIRNPHQVLINVAGHFKQTKYRALAEALLNIIFSLLFVKSYGIYGVLFGTIIAYSYRVIDIIIYSYKKILKTSTKNTLLRILVNLLVAIALYFSGIYIFPDINGFLEWFWYSGLCFIFVTFVFCSINIVVDSTSFLDFLYRINLSLYRKNT